MQFTLAHNPNTAMALAPAAVMLLALLIALAWPRPTTGRVTRLWATVNALSLLALGLTLVGVVLPGTAARSHWLAVTALGGALAVLVQFLGLVIGVFSARYMEGEAGQARFVAALAGVLAAVHTLLMADHWLLLIGAWALVGVALQPLLCFYPDRPFALLAAHKKRLADRLADAWLLAAAGLAWSSVASGSLAELFQHVDTHGASPALQASAVLLVLAVVLRLALLPVHGWLIQVMEAPTPVSALLHAGVVNLGGFVLIRFAPLLEHVPLARGLLVAVGLGTAVLAGLVMLTRISIKVRLAWSTVAQMGFLALECGLGLYTLAALHLIGHSLYKAHTFLAASSAVRNTRLQTLQTPRQLRAVSLWLAPLVSVSLVLGVQTAISPGALPWWWALVLGLAWAPLLWLPAPTQAHSGRSLRVAVSGLLMVAGLTGLTLLAHWLPLNLQDSPHHALGAVALAGMAVLYLGLVLLHTRPSALQAWRRRSYAGFYLDEHHTRLTLWLWPTRWAPDKRASHGRPTPPKASTQLSD